MPVLNSSIWIEQFVEECEKGEKKDPYFIQCDKLCAPLGPLFPSFSTEELHYHLLTCGLFDSSEWKEAGQRVKEMEKNGMWQLAEQEYERLKEEWRGPETAVVLFPIRQAGKRDAIRKNGTAFKKAVFLFLSAELKEQEVKALLAHEYNHVCRLAFLTQDEAHLSLKEALVLEGLAEWAVKEQYGEGWLAPWTKQYSLIKTMNIWQKAFVPSLEVTGPDGYHDFLYGKAQRQLPKWIGYCIGFRIVESFMSRHGPFEVRELLQITADDLIAGSAFSI